MALCVASARPTLPINETFEGATIDADWRLTYSDVTNRWNDATYKSGVTGAPVTAMINAAGSPISLARDPQNEANGVMKFTIADNPHEFRSELMQGYGSTVPQNRAVWYSSKVLLPGDWQTGGFNNIIMQWHANVDESKIPPGTVYKDYPLLALEVVKGRYNLQVNWDSGNPAYYPGSSTGGRLNLDLGEIHLGQWDQFVISANFTTDITGFVRVWNNGALVGSYNGPLGYTETLYAPYFVIGPYNPARIGGLDSGVTRDIVMYMDDVRMGFSSDDVVAVPEPSVYGLSGVAFALTALAKRRRRS